MPALVAELGILRQLQTAQAGAFNASRYVKRRPGPLTPPEQLLPVSHGSLIGPTAASCSSTSCRDP